MEVLLSSTLGDFQNELQSLFMIDVALQILKIGGLPPKNIDLTNKQISLSEAGIKDRETIILDKDTELEEKIKEEVKVNGEATVLRRRIVPADNSCLFKSVADAFYGPGKVQPSELRKVVAQAIKSKPDYFNEAILEKTNANYIEWIQQDKSWGGAIELLILASHLKVEIAAVDIEYVRYDMFGDGFPNRIYLMYSGIHYDYLAQNKGEDLEKDKCQFAVGDESALEGAMEVARELKRKKEFFNVGTLTMRCAVCMEQFSGHAQAQEHADKTGHQNFEQS